MPKPFPEMIFLKQEKCPTCGDQFHNPRLHREDGVIRAVCKKQGCGYSVDLFWLGEVGSLKN